ncbi:MAG: thioredoxin family protein [Planctomycetota bacterium]
MNSAMRAMAVSLLLLSSSGVLSAAEIDTDGATVGKWTMDIDAAKALAKEKKLPVLLNFTGSDWCGWCKLMDRNVFTKQQWKDYAGDNLVMVFIDFPKGAGLVPQKYVARNAKLKDEYGVEGFPTFVVLDDDAETVLAKLGAGRDKTPKSFIAEFASATRYSTRSVAVFTKSLSPAKRLEYMKIVDQMAKNRRLVQVEKALIEQAQTRVKDLDLKVAMLKRSATEFRASLLGPEKLDQYKQLRSDFDAAQKKLKDWLATGPQRTPENTQKFRSMSSEVEQLKAKLSEY